MKGFRIQHNHVLLTDQIGEYSLNEEGYVVGVSIEILSTSTATDLTYGFDEPPKIPIAQGEGARAYGGFESCNVPCWYKGIIKWSFATAVNCRGLLIITTLAADEKEIPGTR